MSENKVKLNEMSAPRPDADGLRAAYKKLEEDFAETKTPKDRYEVLIEWDKLRSQFQTWSALAGFRFTQDTKNPEYKKEREYADELGPIATGLDVAMKRQFLANGQDIEKEIGVHALELWKSDVTGFRDEIQEDMVKEAKRASDYTELISSAEIPFKDQTCNLSELYAFQVDPDRETRHEAAKAAWGFFEENGEALDTIFDDLVKIRTEKARKLGFDTFVPMGYLEMQRVDYDSNDVENYRKQVRDHVVPLCSDLRVMQKERLGIDKVMAWDGNTFSKLGNPKPPNDMQTMLDAGVKMFDGLDPEIGKFFRMMKNCDLLDLDSRKGKAGGGYCNSFSDYRVPVIFANFNGTLHDVNVLTHEMGHAFQYYKSANKHPIDYTWPTYESCEIHSMSLEFFTWPYMDLFFGDDAERFREVHLIGSILFLPYGCAVDHFQHLVYENPDATPAERHEMWHQMEKLYLPELDWGDLTYPAKGGCWQRQLHIYGMPFYYIDYTLAQTCALQYLRWADSDHKKALKSYIKLCGRGGEDSFQNLVRSAGLTSPFEDGCLEGIMEFCRKQLKI